MSKITKLTPGRSREKRVNVFLDGKFIFSLLTEVAIKEGLQVGQELSANQVELLTKSNQFHRGFSAAIRYLSYRPRSEAEVRQRLQRHGFNGDCIEKVIAKLKEQGLVDDTAFARAWKENRESFRPRSKQLTRLELQRKGLDSGIIDQIVSEVDNGDSAYRAAVSKARRLSASEFPDFRRRLGEYLRRRGFDYEVINHTVERVWKEYASSPR
jgi:regulatory protein